MLVAWVFVVVCCFAGAVMFVRWCFGFMRFATYVVVLVAVLFALFALWALILLCAVVVFVR